MLKYKKTVKSVALTVIGKLQTRSNILHEVSGAPCCNIRSSKIVLEVIDNLKRRVFRLKVIFLFSLWLFSISLLALFYNILL